MCLTPKSQVSDTWAAIYAKEAGYVLSNITSLLQCVLLSSFLCLSIHGVA
jgi:hypothetical protein